MGWTDVLTIAKRRLATDQDNSYWVSGRNGCGKSTLALIVGANFDPHFQRSIIAGDPRIGFGNFDFLRVTIGRNPGDTVIGDELDLSNRTVMHGKHQLLMDHLRDNRARNLNMGIIYPWGRMADEDLLASRCAWRFHCHDQNSNMPGGSEWLYSVYEPKQPKYWDRSREFGRWRYLFTGQFRPITGPMWDAYLKVKREYMDRKDQTTLRKIARVEARELGDDEEEEEPKRKRGFAAGRPMDSAPDPKTRRAAWGDAEPRPDPAPR